MQLFARGRCDSLLCPKCNAHNCDLIHKLWKCPKLVRYWRDVVTVINQTYAVQLSLDPLISLLGALDEDMYTPVVYIQ